MRKYVVLIIFAGAPFAVARCGGELAATPPPPTDAGHPARRAADAGDAGDAADLDATLGTDAPADAASDGCWIQSDWPGFRRLTELDPCIKNDVLVDPDAGFSLAWTDCPDGAAPGCKAVPLLQTTAGWDVSWYTDRVDAYATHDDAGAGADMMVTQLAEIDNSTYKTQWDVFDVKTQRRLAEWRDQPESIQDGYYYVQPFSIEATDHATAYFAIVHSGQRAAYGAADVLATSNPLVTQHAQFPWAYGAVVSDYWAMFIDSPRTVCLDSTWNCAPYTLDVGGEYIDFAWHDVVFSTAGDNEKVLNAGTPPTILRAVPNTHVWGFRTDGIHMAWNQSWGDPNIINDQTATEVWVAPFTLDPGVLDASAKKVATLGKGRMGWTAMYFNGLYSFNYGGQVYVVDTTTGQWQIVPTLAGYGLSALAYVDHTAIWEVLQTISDHQIFLSIPLK